MINFPNSPSQGQVFTSTTGLQYVYLDGVWRIVEAPQDIGKAEARNRIVNGAVQISQEWGNTAGGPLGGINFYAADQWNGQATTTGTVTFQRVQAVTPNGSQNRLRMTVGTADASLTAGEYLQIIQPIEGARTADFGYGTASARQSILRFGWKSPAGTWSIRLYNGAALNRSYIANFTISAGQANTDTVQTLVIPGDVTGTWPIDTNLSLVVCFMIANAATAVGVAGWQAGNFSITSSNTNGLATAGAVYELYDVGLYLDPLNTGIAPPWQMPDEAEELRACQRYFQTAHMTASGYTAAVSLSFPALLPVPMRTTPAFAALGPATNTNTTGAQITSAASHSAASGCRLTAGGVATGGFIASAGASISARM
jgi:hypothetical protein